MKENGPKKTETPEEKELHRGKGTLRRIQSDESRRYGEEHRRKPEDGVDETVEMRDGGDRPVCERGYNRRHSADGLSDRRWQLAV
ncbi:hypothetical protein MCC01947_18090 [Bifidobacteriaceae bacterium MCC01947]|nr:hypothetical protein MCC01943_02220 [Bifidobacteriaceae bacterium MCC01943]GDY98534.1 hypothetical protein MCC01947_18090 [Bifidobacteriaceae bacterium MCC01947]GDZ01851.1 hypothetical protein MCC01941_11020 [Bifidobacteriaceae bacterium MCC01941]